MRTVDVANVLREWEFKLFAGPAALGQILTYVALSRREKAMMRPVRGVIAAFGFAKELLFTVEQMNLGIEFVVIPELIRWVGRRRPAVATPFASIDIPPLVFP